DHADPLLLAGTQDALHEVDEVSRVPGARVLPLLALHDRHRDFGQVIEGEVVDPAPFDERHRRIDGITPETLAVRDANEVARHAPRRLLEVSRLLGAVADEVAVGDLGPLDQGLPVEVDPGTGRTARILRDLPPPPLAHPQLPA